MKSLMILAPALLLLAGCTGGVNSAASVALSSDTAIKTEQGYTLSLITATVALRASGKDPTGFKKADNTAYSILLGGRASRDVLVVPDDAVIAARQAADQAHMVAQGL